MKILELLQTYKSQKKILVLINKADLAPKLDLQSLNAFNPLSLTLKGDLYDDNSLLEQFKTKLKNLLDSSENVESLLLISEYQFQAVQTCINALRDSIVPLREGELELFSFHLNDALKAIASITKPYEYTQMLDVMFGDFCLGK